MISNRKARLLLNVPVNKDGNFAGFRLSNRITEIRRKGRYCVTHVDDSRAQKRRRKRWERQRDEDMARWRALGVAVDPAQYTGRV